MKPDITIWLPPMLTLLGTLLVVTFTAWLNTRSVLAQIEAVKWELKTSIETLRGEVKADIAALRLDVMRIEHRVEKLEERAGVIYRP